jgi:replicative DNA helicase Mcm
VWNLLPPDNKRELHVRIKAIPRETSRLEIRNLRADHLDTMIAIDGLVRKVVEVRPKIMMAYFQCVRCNAIMRVPQDNSTIKEPFECSKDEVIYVTDPGCGRSVGGQGGTAFKLLQRDSVFMDTQKIEIQESPEGLRGGAQPQRLVAYLDDDLVGQIFPGDRVILNGILRATPRREGLSKKTVFDINLYVNNVELEVHAYEEVKITDDEEVKIKAMSRDPDIFNQLTQSIAPSIYGMTTEKEALMLQLFGGVTKTMPDETRVRGDIHILLVGDPGTAKSQLLRYVSTLAPRGIYASGKSASAAGLTAAAVKDEFGEGRWTLEAGALVLADKGIACIDELDKMTTQDRSSMHEAMEQQSIHVAKAGITATLQSRCSVLAAANPKFGRFDQFASLPEQINLPAALLSRFDLIFSIMDVPNEKKDQNMAEHILLSHYAGEITEQRRNEKGSRFSEQEEDEAHILHQPEIEGELLRKYIAFAKRRVFPVMTEEALEVIMRYYVDLRSEGKDGGAIPITPRQLEAYVRLAEASARVRLSDRATVEDANRAIEIVDYYLRRVASAEGGGFDIDKITTGISSSKRDRIKAIRDIIGNNIKTEKGGASVDEIYEIAERERNIPRDETRDILQKLMREGSIYYPRHNVVSITPLR